MAFWSDYGVDFATADISEPKQQFRFIALIAGQNSLKPYLVKRVDRPKFQTTIDVVRRGDRRQMPGKNLQLVAEPLGEHTIVFADAAGGKDDVSFFFYSLLRKSGYQGVFDPAGAMKRVDFSPYWQSIAVNMPFIRVHMLEGKGGISSLFGGILGAIGGASYDIAEEIIYYDPMPTNISFGENTYEGTEIIEVSLTFVPSYIKMNKDNKSTMFSKTGEITGEPTKPQLSPLPFPGTTYVTGYGDSKLLGKPKFI
jgi:hypothetical protein